MPQNSARNPGREIILNYLKEPESLRNDPGAEPSEFSERGTGDRLYDLLPEVKPEPLPYERLQDLGKTMLMDFYKDPSNFAPMPMIIPTARNFPQFLTKWRAEKAAGGLRDASGAAIDPTSPLANMYSWVRTRRPKLSKQKHVSATQLVDFPPDPTGKETSGNYIDKLVVEEMKKDALADPALHADILKYFNINNIDELKPWININRELNNDLAEAVKTYTEEYFHALQDVKGKLPKTNAERAYSGLDEKMKLPHEAAAERAADRGFNDFVKFANLVNSPEISPQQKIRYINLLQDVPDFFDEADNLIYYPKGTFKGEAEKLYEEMREIYKPKPGWLKKKKFK